MVQEISIVELTGAGGEMAALQRVIEDAPTYAELVTGAPPGLADAQSTYTALPPGMTYADKHVFGVYLGSQMVGCIDLIKGYPAPDTALLGLLLIAESFQGRGIGSAAYRATEATVRAWGTCTKIRLGVVRTNAAVLPFWIRLGFTETGETKPYSYGPVRSEIVILTQKLVP
jgi:GNAT superfamily N-acetyltransferase